MILFPTPIDQFLPFLICSFVMGIILGALYEIFRLRRIASRCGTNKAERIIDTVIVAVEDTVFLVFVAVVMALIAYKLNYGIPRWYSYGAAILGVILWRKTAGRLVIKLGDKIILLVKRILKTVFGRIIFAPIRLVLKIIGKFILRIENNRARSYTERYQSRILDAVFKE